MREKRLTSDEVKRHCGFVPYISLQSACSKINEEKARQMAPNVVH